MIHDDSFTVDRIDGAAGSIPGPFTLRVHRETNCTGHPCVVHHPSGHHMRGWPTLWRYDKHTLERVCPHGIGHPDPDDLSYQLDTGNTAAAVHGCCGCCGCCVSTTKETTKGSTE